MAPHVCICYILFFFNDYIAKWHVVCLYYYLFNIEPINGVILRGFKGVNSNSGYISLCPCVEYPADGIPEMGGLNFKLR